MNHHLAALSRGKIQTRRKYPHAQVRSIEITEWLALLLNNRIAVLKTANDIKAFLFILTLSGGVMSSIYLLRHFL